MGVQNENIDVSPQGAKIALNYLFEAANGLVIVNEIDFEEVLYIINTETNTTIYNVSDSFLTAELHNNQLTVDYDTTSMLDTDKLLIVYASKERNIEAETLIEILQEIKITNKLLKKILY